MSGVQQAVFQNQRSFGAAPDAQFNYVTMLLHGDGTNGAQNNTFLDSSANTFTITRNGNTTQGSFSPYGSNWSNFFAGSDYLTLASNTAFNIFGGDMTVECWFNATSLTNSPHLFAFVQDASNRESIYFNSGALTFYSSSGAGSGNRIATATISTGVWYHYALVKSGSTFTAYLNGVSVGTSTTTQYSTANQSLQLGTYNSGGYAGDNFNGYMSNVRVVKGTAVYTSSFTPSTTPLTAITNTQLLTSQSNRFVDNSASPLTITPTATSVQRFNPFGTATAYSTSVIGGSGYFDGSGDYLDVPSSADFGFGTGDFTIECWVYPLSSAAQRLVFFSNDMNNLDIGFSPANTFQYYNGSVVDTGISAASRQWFHFAASRTSGTTSVYVNGVRTNNVSDSSNTSTRSVLIASSSGTYPFNGYINDVRVIKGSGIYSGTTITVPTAPLTAVTNTKLLLNYTNGAIFDNAMMNDLETVGNAQISTSVKKYGTGSLAFDGTGDYLVSNSPTTDLYAFGSGNFTIEFWLYLNSVSGYIVPYDGRASGANSTTPTIYLFTATPRYYVNGADRITGSSLSTGQWYHIAVARSGTSTKLFINGTQSGSTYTDSTVYTNTINRPLIAGDGNAPNTNLVNGYMDDVRITKGYARYTANFTAPTAALPDTGPY
jgi:hypothetical protein